MRILALMFVILLLKAKGIAYTSEFIGDCALWIIDHCAPKTRRRT